MGGGSTWTDTDGVVDAGPAGGESGRPRPEGAAGRQTPPIGGQKALPEGTGWFQIGHHFSKLNDMRK